jgi:hypothetical protein
VTDSIKIGLAKQEVLALRGLRLPAPALNALRRAGIYCQPSVSIQFQQQAKRYLIRGVESGGAAPNIGAYCGFVCEAGTAFTAIQPVPAISVNGLHVAVLSPALVRVQMFRAGNHYQLLLTHHFLALGENKSRPSLCSTVLFHGRNGALEMELWGKDRHSNGVVAPVFYSKSGDRMMLPACLDGAVFQVTAGVCCIGCRHSHVANSRECAAPSVSGDVVR